MTDPLDSLPHGRQAGWPPVEVSAAQAAQMSEDLEKAADDSASRRRASGGSPS